ncbi:MAG TPA: hypothetical protein VFC67_00725 [Prolixibacteraceae bacterium]|nr:hypothetical protein [Prolixibacteraceae bacterium]
MEAKTLLKLIKEDIAHLEGITCDFLFESLPASDEVELALVRAKALLRELELLHKIAAQHESIPTVIEPSEEQKGEIQAYFHSEKEPFEPVAKEDIADGQKTILITDLHDFIPVEEVQGAALKIESQQNTKELSEVEPNAPLADGHFTALVEPTESVDIEPVSPVVEEEEKEEVGDHLADLTEPAESGDFVPASQVVIEEEVIDNLPAEVEPEKAISATTHEPIGIELEVPDDLIISETETSDTIEIVAVPENLDQKEEILADEFKEVKKTLNETLGESHQMVNDILSSEKDETEYKIIPINSIWDGIGINDRFLFIRELFANSSAKFENTVAALDSLATIQDAVSYLKMNFKWNKTEASQKFLVLVKRRFTN